jgi:hypothetical protein
MLTIGSIVTRGGRVGKVASVNLRRRKAFVIWDKSSCGGWSKLAALKVVW